MFISFRKTFLIESIFVYLSTIFKVFRHIIYAIFIWQLVVKTAGCFNNIVFILVAKISSKKSLWKNGKQFNVDSRLTSVLQQSRLLRLVGTGFDSKVVSLGRMRKKNLIILQIINKQMRLFLFVFCWHMSCQISIESVWKIVICSLNVLMTKLYLKFYSIL